MLASGRGTAAAGLRARGCLIGAGTSRAGVAGAITRARPRPTGLPEATHRAGVAGASKDLIDAGRVR